MYTSVWREDSTEPAASASLLNLRMETFPLLKIEMLQFLSVHIGSKSAGCCGWNEPSPLRHFENHHGAMNYRDCIPEKPHILQPETIRCVAQTAGKIVLRENAQSHGERASPMK
eukprot:Gb_15702 [translate_table: standard]